MLRLQKGSSDETLGEAKGSRQPTCDPAARSAAAISQSPVLPSWGMAGTQGADWAGKKKEEPLEMDHPPFPNESLGPMLEELNGQVTFSYIYAQW